VFARTDDQAVAQETAVVAPVDEAAQARLAVDRQVIVTLTWGASWLRHTSILGGNPDETA